MKNNNQQAGTWSSTKKIHEDNIMTTILKQSTTLNKIK